MAWPATVVPGEIATAAQYNALVAALASAGGDISMNEYSLKNTLSVQGDANSKVLRLTGIVRAERYTDNQNYVELNCESLPAKFSHSLGQLEIDWKTGPNFYRLAGNASNALEFAGSGDGVTWNPGLQIGPAGNVTLPKNFTVMGTSIVTGGATFNGGVTVGGYIAVGSAGGYLWTGQQQIGLSETADGDLNWQPVGHTATLFLRYFNLNLANGSGLTVEGEIQALAGGTAINAPNGAVIGQNLYFTADSLANWARCRMDTTRNPGYHTPTFDMGGPSNAGQFWMLGALFTTSRITAQVANDGLCLQNGPGGFQLFFKAGDSNWSNEPVCLPGVGGKWMHWNALGMDFRSAIQFSVVAAGNPAPSDVLLQNGQCLLWCPNGTTQLEIHVRGTDGVLRKVAFTLA